MEAAADAGVKRVVLTSSIAAVVGLSKGTHLHDKSDWYDPSKPLTTACEKSKTPAEHKA